jgi:hypothetical protein
MTLLGGEQTVTELCPLLLAEAWKRGILVRFLHSDRGSQSCLAGRISRL